MSRGLFEGHIRIEPSVRDDTRTMETCKYQAAKFVTDKGGRNPTGIILSRKERDGKLVQVDFAVYADFPE